MKIRMMKGLLGGLAFVACSCSVFASDAGNRVYTEHGVVQFVGDDVSANELQALLFPQKVVTRSLFKESESNGVSVAMLIKFEFDSAKVTDNSKSQLDVLGDMLNKEGMAEKKLVVEGHTDIVGSEKYNLWLSKERAESVKQYLVTQHNIESERLDIMGHGESLIIDVANPTGSVNRRVQFMAATR